MQQESYNLNLILQAVSGSPSAAGGLLESYRGYLKLLARLKLNSTESALEASDIVQDVFLRAHRGFAQFRGKTEAELTAWLRQILARCIVDFCRQKKSRVSSQNLVVRKVRLELDETSVGLGTRLIAPTECPSQIAERREAAILLVAALELLQEDYREAIILRHMQGLSPVEVADRMGRTVDSVRKLWARGLVELRAVLKGSV